VCDLKKGENKRKSSSSLWGEWLRREEREIKYQNR